MTRIQPIPRRAVTGPAKPLVEQVEAKWGMVPNFIRTLAHSPAALEGYLSLNSALARGILPAELREQIALTVAEVNQSDYCLAAHLAVGKSVGLSDEEIADSRRGESPDRRTAAALRFVRRVVEYRGWVDQDEVTRLRDTGYGDAEIAEILAHVGLNLLTNYFNHVVETEVDFPAAPVLATA